MLSRTLASASAHHADVATGKQGATLPLKHASRSNFCRGTNCNYCQANRHLTCHSDRFAPGSLAERRFELAQSPPGDIGEMARVIELEHAGVAVRDVQLV
jgi:hypothetical protein